MHAPALQPGANTVLSLHFCSWPLLVLEPTSCSSHGFCGLQLAMLLAVTPCPGMSRWSPIQTLGWPQIAQLLGSGALSPAFAAMVTSQPTEASGKSLHSTSRTQHTGEESRNSLIPSHILGGRCGLATHQERLCVSSSSNPKCNPKC